MRPKSQEKKTPETKDICVEDDHHLPARASAIAAVTPDCIKPVFLPW